MNYWIQNNIFVLIFFITSAAFAQPGNDFVWLDEKVSLQVNKNTTQIPLVFFIKEGYYIQANKVKDESLIPTEIIFEQQKAVTLGEAKFPKPKTHIIGDDSLDVFGGKTKITIPISIHTTTKSRFPLKGKLYYQACDKLKCYFPREYNFTIALRLK